MTTCFRSRFGYAETSLACAAHLPFPKNKNMPWPNGSNTIITLRMARLPALQAFLFVLWMPYIPCQQKGKLSFRLELRPPLAGKHAAVFFCGSSSFGAVFEDEVWVLVVSSSFLAVIEDGALNSGGGYSARQSSRSRARAGLSRCWPMKTIFCMRSP